MSKKNNKYKIKGSVKTKKTKKTKAKNSKLIYLVVLALLFTIYITKPELLGVNKYYKTVETECFRINKIDDGFAKIPDEKYEIYDRTYYSFAYSTEYNGSFWVAYILTKKMVKTDAVDREDEKFARDPQLSEDYAVTSDYTNSGYDRGHLCPAGDMNFNQTAMTETFFLTNILPQKPKLNRGIWKELEEQARLWAIENDSLYIVVGALYDENPKTIGKNKIAVPSKFYKVVADISKKDGYKAIAFIFENKDYSSDDYFMNYALSVEELEKLTGIDFFYNFQNKDVEQIEITLNKNHWK